MIPRIIHYCWFGYGPKPAVFDKCIQSWKKYMPDFQIIEWNEGNVDLHSCKFLSDAYASKKWAFVSDVVRLQVIYDMGGIYMDTDVELFDTLETYCDSDSFFFFQNHNQINTGMGFGAVKKHPLLKAMLEDYNQTKFDPTCLGKMACPEKNTRIISRIFPNLKLNSQNQCVQNNLFLGYETYYMNAKHYGEFSWRSEEQNQILRYTKEKSNRNWKFLMTIRAPKIFEFMDCHHLVFMKKVYTFLVYDFVDLGAKYWLLKLLYKAKNLLHRKNI